MNNASPPSNLASPGRADGTRLALFPASWATPTEVAAHQTATRNSSSPDEAGDDFGLLRALPLVVAGGLAAWGAALWCLL